MQRLALVIGASILWATAVEAHQSDPLASAERVRLALKSPSTQTTLSSPLEPDRRALGILTLLPPERPGEIARLSLPVGELATRGIRAIGKAQRRRAERKAHEEVQRALRDFRAQKR